MGTMSSDTDENGGPRYRRATSVSRAEEITKEEAKVRKSQPDKPCHRPRDSLFSWSSGFNNFTGFVNWAFLLLTVGGLRLLLENFIKYGIRVDPVQWIIFLTGSEEGGSGHPSFLLLSYSAIPVVLCLLIEKGLSVEIIPHSVGMASHVINILVMVMVPMIVIHVKNTEFSLIGASIVCMTYSILFLKLWSYIQVNMWCRSARNVAVTKTHLRRQSLTHNGYNGFNNGEVMNGCVKEHRNGKLVQYPDNLNLKDIYYFILAPTLCYELNFPKTDRIRKRFLLKRLLEVIVGFQVIFCLFQQWMVPSVKNSLIPFSNMDIAKATERLLKLAIPNHLVWLIFFYLMFHSFLNLVGEVMHFADRNFYSDWWNADNIDIFWRTWNMPVHRWAVRHLYIPLVDRGYNRNLASTSVFFISAFFHEYLVSVPLRTFKVWAFMGMMSQIPLSIVCRWIEVKFGSRLSNMVVWSSLILGQPLCIMMYYHDYVVTHVGEKLFEEYGHTQ